MDTDDLRLFARAADRLNISAAGRELGMAPAVASARLARLERALGADLLIRSTRKVSVSTEGAEFLPYAREIIAQEDAARAALGGGAAKPTGHVRFAASSTFAQLYIISLLPRFHALYPEITLDMRLSDTPFDLIEGSFDLALRNQALADSALKARKLCADTRILCAAPSYLEEFGEPKSPDDLADHVLIGFRSLADVPLVTSRGERAVFSPGAARNWLALDDGLCLKLAVEAGAGIAMSSVWSVHREIKSGRLERLLPQWRGGEETALWLVYPKANVMTAKVRAVIDFLVAELRERVPCA